MPSLKENPTLILQASVIIWMTMILQPILKISRQDFHPDKLKLRLIE